MSKTFTIFTEEACMNLQHEQLYIRYHAAHYRAFIDGLKVNTFP